ncbi:MAG TPA: NUDIX hydrolase [Planococcus sp. (in: firmicutes)]|nr:NUDIX hydrolase [Planococcus sp. (in: firmicutes)]
MMEMSNWQGAAGICVNDKNEVLLVQQNMPEDGDKKWAVPAGGAESGESLRACCEREFFEETGLIVEAKEELTVKKGEYENSAVSFEVHYFRVEVTGGEIIAEDPFGLILDVAWKPVGELIDLNMAYPDDRALIESLLKN